MTWSSSFEARARSAWRPLASFDCSGCPSAGDQRTVALTKWTECFCGGDGGAYLVIIPRVLGFFGPLHLEQVHVVNFAAVETDAAGAEQRIVGRQRLHLRDHGLAVSGAIERNHRLEVVRHRGVDASMDHGGMAATIGGGKGL